MPQCFDLMWRQRDDVHEQYCPHPQYGLDFLQGIGSGQVNCLILAQAVLQLIRGLSGIGYSNSSFDNSMEESTLNSSYSYSSCLFSFLYSLNNYYLDGGVCVSLIKIYSSYNDSCDFPNTAQHSLFLYRDEKMSSLFVEIGQCGCQIGAHLNPKLSSSYYCSRLQPPNRLHSILIDTEPKVIQSLLGQKPRWLDPSNIKYFEYGRGNNWSYGYLHQLPEKKFHQQFLPKYKQHSHGELSAASMERYLNENKAIWQFVAQKVRKQLETMDCAMAINVISSLGGGTGSGLGTKIVQKLNENFQIDIFGHFILPNKSGQTPLQVYNCSLSLASLQENCKAIFTYQNDKIMSLFRNAEQKQSTIEDINAYLSSSIARFIQVNDVPKYDRFYGTMASECILSPQLKYLNVFTQENKKGNWEQVFVKLFQEVKNYHHDEYGDQFGRKDQRESLLHGQLLLLGKQETNYDQRYSKKLRQILNPVYEDSLNVQEFKSNFYDQKQKKKGQQKCTAILVSNHSHILNYLQYLLESGRKKLQAKAYLWHYQYVDIQNAFDSLQNVTEQYYYSTRTK